MAQHGLSLLLVVEPCWAQRVAVMSLIGRVIRSKELRRTGIDTRKHLKNQSTVPWSHQLKEMG